MKWLLTQASPTGNSFSIGEPASRWQNVGLHAYYWGTFGAAGSIAIEYSPDLPNIADGSSNWFRPTALTVSTKSDVYFLARFNKIRAVLASGGDGTTSVNVQVF